MAKISGGDNEISNGASARRGESVARQRE